jgi:hypothetical protein
VFAPTEVIASSMTKVVPPVQPVWPERLEQYLVTPMVWNYNQP